MNEEILDTTSEKQVPVGRVKTSKGNQTVFAPGVSGNPAGRPKGSVSIKDKIRQHLEEHPEEVQEVVKHFVKDNRELMWQMLEGSPKSTSEVNTKSIHIEITGEDLLLAQELEAKRQLNDNREKGAE